MNQRECQQRDEQIRSAMERYEGPLVRYAAQIVHDGECARDIVQDVFMKLVVEPSPPADGSLASWLFRVCRNRAIDVLRKEQRMTPLADETAQSIRSEGPGPDRMAELHDSTGKLLRLLRLLPPNQQEVLRLKFEGGLAYRQIAEVTGLSVTNVGFLIHTGIKNLRARYQPAAEA